MKSYLLIFTLLITGSLGAVTRDEAMRFLKNSISLPDKADYPEEFYIKNIDASLKAREEMPWGHTIPDREFMHFVLPVRVNNESLDTARLVFYPILKERVKGMTMEEAILEVNHWCHEHVTYKPSDGRTSSPLSTLSQAIGRCGEESTFTVAALRSVGIPARQIYTPRWAHTDDNHAWVEVWVDGKWYFLGACEPEPILNLAWFNSPASRGLMMSTNVAGDYNGEEEILEKNNVFTKINVTSNYAPTDILNVRAVYPDGSPASGADVSFSIYNYGEFYPVVTKRADENGKAFLRGGLGDFIIWVSDGENYGISKGNPKDFDENNPLTVILDLNDKSTASRDIDIMPPLPGKNIPEVTAEQRARNDYLLAREDSLRNVYTSSFLDSDQILKLDLPLNQSDKFKSAKVISEARGNQGKLISLIGSLPVGLRSKALDLLSNVSEKDRRDISRAIVEDHLTNVVDIEDFEMNGTVDSVTKKEIYDKYILNPRIENEFIYPWRGYLTEYFSPAEKTEFKDNPQKLYSWIQENIEINNDYNPQGIRMNPASVAREKKTDSNSAKIFFVAAARSAGIPARINPVDGSMQWIDGNGEWVNVDEKSAELDKNEEYGYLNLTWDPGSFINDPGYYTHFTLSKIKDGKRELLEYDEGSTFSSLFNKVQNLSPGQYMLTSGQRLANGGVLGHYEIFSIVANDTVTLPLKIREDDSKLSVIGSINSENIYYDLDQGREKSILSTTGRGYFVVGLIKPGHEPSAHVLNDLLSVADGLRTEGNKIVILFDSEEEAARFDSKLFKEFPDYITFGVDVDGKTSADIMNSLNLEKTDYPVFVIGDTFNRIIWVSTGYVIGIGDSIRNNLKRANNNE